MEITKPVETNEPANCELMLGMLPSDYETKQLEPLADGHLRSVRLSSGCYCQIQCGGQWYYVYQDGSDGIRRFAQCGQSGWSASCNGNRYQVACR